MFSVIDREPDNYLDHIYRSTSEMKPMVVVLFSSFTIREATAMVSWIRPDFYHMRNTDSNNNIDDTVFPSYLLYNK